MRLLACTLAVALVACGSGNSTAPQPHTLIVQVSGNGTVTSSPAGIDCGSNCVATFSQAVTLTATAGAGAIFSGWDGGCSGMGTCTLPMSADAAAKATFQATPPPKTRVHTLDVTVQDQGESYQRLRESTAAPTAAHNSPRTPRSHSTSRRKPAGASPAGAAHAPGRRAAPL